MMRLIYCVSFVVALAFMLVCREVDGITMEQQIKLFFMAFGGIMTIMICVLSAIRNNFTHKNLTHLMIGEFVLFLGFVSLFL